VLNDYIQRVRLLVGDQNTLIHNSTDVVRFINEAREDCALMTECLRQRVIYQTRPGQEVYAFSSVPLMAYPGYGAVASVKSISLVWGSYQFMLDRRSFSDYQAYVRNYAPVITDLAFQGETNPPQNPVQTIYEPIPTTQLFFTNPQGQQLDFNQAETGGYAYIPCVWSCQGMGVNDQAWMFPIPNSPYYTLWDCVCTPEALTSDSTVEAIPVPWTRAIPYYAAFRLIESLPFSENPGVVKARQMMIDRLLKTYQTFLVRGRFMVSKNFTGSKYGRS